MSKIPLLLTTNVLDGPVTRQEGSLTVVTWTQGATANWLVMLYLYTILGGGGEGGGGSDGVQGVVMVSFLRDERFWREGCGKMGLNLDRLAKSGRFAFIDGLLAAGDDAGLDVLRETARAARADRPRTVLIVDGMDGYMALSSTSAATASSTLMELREAVYSTILVLAADGPLMRAAPRRQGGEEEGETGTPLERNHAALVVGQAHAAGRLVSLRGLDTGAARDVSGVLRVTGDGGGGEELLYHVSGDGSVRVFERGA